MIQVIGAIIPLITLPIISTKLPLSDFAGYLYILSIYGFSYLIVDFGLTNKMIGQIAERDTDTNYLLSGAILFKFINSVLLCVIISVVLKYIPVLNDVEINHLLIAGTIIIQSIIPTFYLIGRGAHVLNVLIIFVGKLIYFFSIIIFPLAAINDILLIFFISITLQCMLSFSATILLGGKLALINFNYREVYASVHSFGVARVMSISYTNYPFLISGLVLDTQNLFLYGIFEQLFRSAQNLFGPLITLSYEHSKKNKNDKLLTKIMLFSTLVFFCFSPVLNELSLLLSEVLYKVEQDRKGVFVLLAVIATQASLLAALSGYPLFSVFDKEDHANRSIKIVGILAFFYFSLLLFKEANNAILFVLGVIFCELLIFFLRALQIHSITRSK